MKPNEKHFKFLDGLRESGECNMFGAGPYVQAEFGLAKLEARSVVHAWMRTFDGQSSIAERLAKVEVK